MTLSSWFRFCLGRPRSTLLATTVLVLASAWWTVEHVPIAWTPTVELPVLQVEAAWPGAPPRTVERHLTAPIERTLRTVPGAVHVESRSTEGRAVLRLQVSERRRLRLYAAEVADQLSAMRPILPPHVVPRLRYQEPESIASERNFMIVQLVGSVTSRDLRQLAESWVAPRLRSIEGVSGVLVDGGHEEELRVTLDPDRLRSHRLEPDELERHLRRVFSSRSFGWLAAGAYGRRLLWSEGASRLDDLRALPVAGGGGGPQVRLSDVARVERLIAPVRSISRVSGEPAVTLSLEREPNSHLLESSASVRASLAELSHELPWGVRTRIAADDGDRVRQEMRELVQRGGLGLLAVVGVLVWMLRNTRAVLAVLVSAAAALASGLACLGLLDLGLDALTLAALALLIGLLVDNAAILMERLLVELRCGGRRAAYDQAVGRALGAVMLPLLGGTLSTMVVFLPMVYLSGELRGLFASLAVLASLTLALSLLFSAILVPTLGQGLKGSRLPRPRAWPRRLATAFYAVAGRRPVVVLVLLSLAIGLPMSLLPEKLKEPPGGWSSAPEKQWSELYNRTLGHDYVRWLRRYLDPFVGGVNRSFLENVEVGHRWDFEQRPELSVGIKLPPGSGIERTEELIRPYERLALSEPAVERTLLRVIEGLAFLRIVFPDAALDGRPPFALRQQLIEHAIQTSGIEVGVSGLLPTGFYTGLGEVSGHRVELLGPSFEKLDEIAAELSRRLHRDPRVAAVDTDAGRRGQSPGRESFRLSWGAEAVRRSSVDAARLTAILRARLVADTPAFYARIGEDVRLPVRLVVDGADDMELEQLLAIPLYVGEGAQLRLEELAELERIHQPPAIDRFDQQYQRRLEMFYRGPYRMGQELIEQHVRTMPLAPGYRLEKESRASEWEHRRLEILATILGAAFGVFLLLAAVVESWRLSALIMTAVPVGWIGVAVAFIVSGESFAEGAFLGVLLTLGIAVNDAVLLTDGYQRLRARGKARDQVRLALIALRGRLRPMWTTTLSSVAGFMPLLVLSEAGDFWLGLSLAVIGGLVASTLLGPAAILALLSLRRGSAYPLTVRERRQVCSSSFEPSLQ